MAAIQYYTAPTASDHEEHDRGVVSAWGHGNDTMSSQSIRQSRSGSERLLAPSNAGWHPDHTATWSQTAPPPVSPVSTPSISAHPHRSGSIDTLNYEGTQVHAGPPHESVGRPEKLQGVKTGQKHEMTGLPTTEPYENGLYQPPHAAWSLPRTFSWWWWEEIGGAVLSVASMLLILIILFKVNNTALASWTLAIQPSSLIAICTTVGKTAMMVPVAACISQLKWRHFQNRPQPLSHLQKFDEASRGPLGAAVLLFSVRTRAILAWSLGIVTIVSLGIDPTAQQILDFPTRQTNLTNVTASIGTAQLYSSKGFFSNDAVYDPTKSSNFTFPIQTSMINGAAGQIFQPFFSCAAPQCTFEPFTTLGFCSTYYNVTDQATRVCDENLDSGHGKKCNYTIPAKSTGQRIVGDPLMSVQFAIDGSRTLKSTLLQADVLRYDSLQHDLRVVKMPNGQWQDITDPIPSSHVFVISFSFCVLSYSNVSASTLGIADGAMITQATPLVLSREWHDPNYRPGFSSGPPTWGIFVDGKSNVTSYKVADETWSGLLNYITRLFTKKLYTAGLADFGNTNGAENGTDAVDIATFLYTSDLEQLGKNLATTLTNQIRSGGVNGTAGDNINSTTITGQASAPEVYIAVRWPWLILPLVETVLALVLLVACIIATQGQPLLKTSVIALLAYPLRGWSDAEIAVPGPQTVEKLDALAEGMVGQLVQDENGQLRFVRMA